MKRGIIQFVALMGLLSAFVYVSMAQEAPRAFERVVFAVKAEFQGYVHKEVGGVLTFAPALTSGPTKRVLIEPPAGMRAFVEWDLDGNATVTFGRPAPEPSPSPSPEPSPSPSHEPSPSPSPSPEPSPTPSPEPTPTPSPSPSPTPSPEPSPSPSSSPTPIPSPTPTPGPCAWGKDVEGVCIEKPPVLSCAGYPDDPVGLLREGFGCDSLGGHGSSEIKVTVLGPDGAVGSLRWAYNQIGPVPGFWNWIQGIFGDTPQQRRVVIDASLSGQITLDSPLYWKKRNTTLDCSLADVTIKHKEPNKDGLVYGATDDVIAYGCRGAGHFAGSDPDWIPQQNSGMFTMDGDVPPLACESWDDECRAMLAVEQRGVRRAIFDRMSLSGCQDDCLASWEGVRDVSITRSFVHDSFHPSTTGAKGAPLPPGRERLRIYWAYNVAARNGERQIAYPREEAYWWVAARNLIYSPMQYFYKDYVDGSKDSNFPMGLSISTMYPRENDYGWVLGNCGLPNPDPAKPFHWNWLIGVAGVSCENAPVCCAPNCNDRSGADIQCCNPTMKGTHWYFDANEGPGATVWEVSSVIPKSNPPGWVPPALPFTPNVSKPWAQVLSEVGVPKRNAAEQALLDLIAVDVPRCKVPQ